jgi:hypothetical protein
MYIKRKCKRFLIILTVLSLVALVGCNQDEDKQSQMKNVNYTKVTSGNVVDQSPSVRAKEFVSKKEETTEVKAVNSKKDLYIAFNVGTFERFQLDKIESDVKKELKKKFPNHTVHVSTDKKVFLELETLEEKLGSNKVKNNKDLNKSLNHIKHMKNDQ